jgi:hypothetical protein
MQGGFFSRGHIAHSGLCRPHFGLARCSIFLHKKRVARSLCKFRQKKQQQMVLCRKRKQRSQIKPPRPPLAPLVLQPEPCIFPLPDSTEDVELRQEDLPQVTTVVLPASTTTPTQARRSSQFEKQISQSPLKKKRASQST